MNFRTELPIAPLTPPLPARAQILTIGSCFAAVLGRQLTASRLPVLENPFGTVLNPVSACRLLAAACGQDDLDLNERIVPRDGRWFSYDAPSTVSGGAPDELARALETRLAEVREFVRTADAVVLTMGTAWAWRLDGEVVANCHKQPGSLFEKTLLSVQQIVSAFAEAHSYLIRLNPKLRIVVTVSPVRHPKETLTGSSVSKSTLRLACHYLQEIRGVRYFPAYELLLDDLRDYRFYGPDMLHPSAVAEEYIFQKFAAGFLAPEFVQAHQEWEEVTKALAHRSAHPTGEAHQSFLRNLLGRLEKLATQGYDADDEIAAVLSQLTPVDRRGNRRPQPDADVTQEPVANPRSFNLPLQRQLVAEPALPTSLSQPAATAPASETSAAAVPLRRENPRYAAHQPTPAALPASGPSGAVPDSPEEAHESTLPAADNTVSPDERPRKRRGKRGGRRNKRKGEGRPDSAEFSAEAGDYADEDETSETETNIPAPRSEPLPVATQALPAANQAGEPAGTSADGLSGASLTDPSPALTGGRRGNRNGRATRPGNTKKVVLQKVKADVLAEADPAAKTAPAAADATATPTDPPAAQAQGQRPAAERSGNRGRSNQKPIIKIAASQTERSRLTETRSEQTPASAPAQSAPAASVLTPTIAPQPPLQVPLVTPPAAPTEVLETVPVPVPETVPETVQAREPAPKTARKATGTARTPGRPKAKGPVATPVQKSTAARQAKKAGVGALLLALGSGAAPNPAPPPPVVPELAAPPPAPHLEPQQALPQAEPVAATAPAEKKPKQKTVKKPVAKKAPKPVTEKVEEPSAKGATESAEKTQQTAKKPARKPALRKPKLPENS